MSLPPLPGGEDWVRAALVAVLVLLGMAAWVAAGTLIAMI